MPGEFDDQLKWPAKVKFIVEVINQQGGNNMIYAPSTLNLGKTNYKYHHKHYFVVSHSKIQEFLANDTLYFHVSKTEVLT